MSELWVGEGKPFARIADAVAAADAGDTIFVAAGVYTNDFASISKDLTIVGVGGMAHFKATTLIPNRKAIFVTTADVTFENIEFSGARVTDQNGAGIRHQAGDLTVKNSYFHDNENGILTSSIRGAEVTITGSEFARNGYGDGQTHGIYVNQVARLTVTESYFHDTKVGHHIKSRADFTEVRSSKLDDGSGDSSYSIDMPNGGGASIVGNTLIQGEDAGNKKMVNYGGEVSTPKPGAVLIEDNTFINHRSAGGIAVHNRTDKIIDFKHNTLIGLDDAGLGPINSVGTILGVLGDSEPEPEPTEPAPQPEPEPEPEPEPQPEPESSQYDGEVTVGTDRSQNIYASNRSDFIQAMGGNDHVWGYDGDDRLEGGAGADRLYGAGGADTLVGGGGSDVLKGGAGADVAVFARNAADYRVTVGEGVTVVEALAGTEGKDQLYAVERLQFADKTIGVAAESASGDDGSEPAQTVDNTEPAPEPEPEPEPEAPAPSVEYDGEVTVGTSRSQNMYASNRSDFIQAMGGDDRIWGYDGDDRLEGGTGADAIYAGDGADILLGGGGADVLQGGAGDDLFVFETGCGADAIADFCAGGGEDVIDLQAFGVGGFAALKALFAENGETVTVDLPGADSVALQGQRIADLTADHFLL